MSTLKVNEALVCYVALYTLSLNIYSFSKLSVILSMATDKEMLRIISNSYGHKKEKELLEKLVNASFNRCYLDLLPTNINAVVILCQSGLVNNNKGILSLTDKGYDALNDIEKIKSKHLRSIIGSIINVLNLTLDIEDVDLFKHLRITL